MLYLSGTNRIPIATAIHFIFSAAKSLILQVLISIPSTLIFQPIKENCLFEITLVFFRALPLNGVLVFSSQLVYVLYAERNFANP